MKKFLIFQFPNLNNYGTGMMGLVTIQEICNRLGEENVTFYCDFNEYANLEEIKRELNGNVNIEYYKPSSTIAAGEIRNPIYRKIKYLNSFLSGSDIKEFDSIIVIGGDGFSEEYGDTAYIEFFKLWLYSFRVKTILLGQTMGPFNDWKNRFSCKYLLPRIEIYARDNWCYSYLHNEFSLKNNLHLSTDLAFCELPLESNIDIKNDILSKYNLKPKDYITFVVSGIQGNGYYSDDSEKYLECWKNIIIESASIGSFTNKRIVLLAHTFKPYGEENQLVENMYKKLPDEIKKRTIVVSERILQTRARHILGNGLLTVTGRMHAAISTFESGVPAVSLAYSPKYKGVIGEGLKREDLIVDANKPILWESDEIVSLTTEKVAYVNTNYNKLVDEIRQAVLIQKRIIQNTLDQICKTL